MIKLKQTQTRSDLEDYFIWWLEDLENIGFIDKWEYEPEEFSVCPPFTKEVNIVKKTKINKEETTVLAGISYTPDFMIKWNAKARGIFVADPERTWTQLEKTAPFIAVPPLYDQDKLVSWIEVKPKFDQNNMTRDFMAKAKFLWASKSLFINLVRPEILFPATFVPSRYMTTDKSLTRPRKLPDKWKVRTASEFIAQRRALRQEISDSLSKQQKKSSKNASKTIGS